MKVAVLDWMREFDQLLVGSGAVRSVMAERDGVEICGYSLRKKGLPVVMISAGMHGDEPAGPLALLELIRGGLLELPFSWLVCPVLNPTGFKLASRENAEGLDMNRDYFYQRSVEVKGHAAWVEDECSVEGIDMFISLHEDWESSGFYFYEINCGEDCPDRAREIASILKEIMPMEPDSCIDGHTVREPGWIYHSVEPDVPDGWPEAIFLAKQGCKLSFTFETPSSFELDLRVDAQTLVVRKLLERMCS